MTAELQRPPRDPLVPPGGVDLHERDMTATFAADVALAELQHRLSAIGQWLPIDGDPSLPVGRLVDENSTGPLRCGYGAWRDLLLGVQFENGRGELISAGGRTVKNVAGYDLTKFMVGQRGQFGRIVTITTRTYRRPAGAILATLPPAINGIPALLASPLKPQWALLTPTELCLGYLGDERTLRFYRDKLPVLNPASVVERSVEADIEHRRSLWSQGNAPRRSVPPAALLDFVRSSSLAKWCADPVFGIVRSAALGDAPAPSAAEKAIIERLRRAFT